MNIHEMVCADILSGSAAAGRKEDAVGRHGVALYAGDDQSSAAQQNDVNFCTLPPNATHLMQPLDVSVFGPMKCQWRNILVHRDEEEGMLSDGDLPQCHAALDCRHRTYSTGQPDVWLQDFDVLKKHVSAPVNCKRAVGILNAGLIDILERNHGTDDQPQRRRPTAVPMTNLSADTDGRLCQEGV